MKLISQESTIVGKECPKKKLLQKTALFSLHMLVRVYVSHFKGTMLLKVRGKAGKTTIRIMILLFPEN